MQRPAALCPLCQNAKPVGVKITSDANGIVTLEWLAEGPGPVLMGPEALVQVVEALNNHRLYGIARESMKRWEGTGF